MTDVVLPEPVLPANRACLVKDLSGKLRSCWFPCRSPMVTVSP